MDRQVLYFISILLTASLAAAKQKTVCSPYPYTSVEHGAIRRVSFQKYDFRCDESHFLASGSTVRCYRGNWTSLQEPRCLRKQGRCDEPPVVANASVHGTERGVGSSVKYICREGFTLLGHSELVCSRSGHWDRRAPACMDQREPLENVAERLKDSFVTQLQNYSADTPQGRLLDSASLRLGLELFLLVDRSSSVDPVHLEDAKTFIKFLLARFKVRNGANNENGTRAAVFAFGTEVQTVFDVDYPNISNPLLAASAIDAIQPNGGGTNMEGALTHVLLAVVKLRPKSKRALFLMTDGEPNVANPEITPQDLAQELKNFHEFEIFTVGIGKGINVQLLNELASEPPLSHVFILQDYPNLNEVMKIIEDSKPPPPPISAAQCGYSAAGEEDRPWLATLYVGGEGPFRVCGGVLICDQWVLTAGSCFQEGERIVDKQNVFVVLGERHLLRDEQGQTNFYAHDLRLHPHYDSREAVRDNLALVRLNLPASRYRPACLPPTDRAIPLHLNLKVSASIAGWGVGGARRTLARARDLLFDMNSTSVSLSEERECPGRGTAHHLCAGQGSRSCYGLAGSPLVAEDSTTHFRHVIGILADRTRCARGQNQYVELTKHVGWINHVTSGCHLRHWGLAE